MIFESKRKVSAVKFDGNNINDVRKLMGHMLLSGRVWELVVEYVSANGYAINIDEKLRILKVGDYLVREKGKFQIMSAKYFEDTFKPSFPSDLEEQCEEFVIDRVCMFIEEFYNNKSVVDVNKFKLNLLHEIDLTRKDNGHTV